MTVLLPTDTVEVLRAVEVEDEHGWHVHASPPVAVYSGPCNLQVSQPRSDARASEAGGHGLLEPSHIRAGTCYLEPDAGVEPGDTLAIRGTLWIVDGVQGVLDPAGAGADVTLAYVHELVSADA